MNPKPRTHRPVLALAAVAGPVQFLTAWIVPGFVNRFGVPGNSW